MDIARRWRLEGARALVTGGTQGIGLAISNELLGLGARLLVAARDRDALARQVAAWRAAGHDAHGEVADVTVDADRERLIAAATSRLGGLDLLVNNVGTNIRGVIAEYKADDYRRLFEVNVISAFDLCRRAHPLLRAGTRPAVVTITSVSGLVHARNIGVYGSTKAMLNQLTKSLAVEWAPDGIRVNAVAPWYVRTRLTAPVLEDEASRTRIVSRVPLGRVGEPEDVAGAAAWLCLPSAAYVTGQVIAVDGGMTAFGA